MTHGEFITKREARKPMFEFWNDGQRTWTEVASEFDLPGPMQAASAVRYYERHAEDPACPLLANVTHYSANVALTAISFKSMEQMRGELIRKFSASIGCAKAYPKQFPQRVLKTLLKASGLEWFSKDGRAYIHWKHDRELAA